MSDEKALVAMSGGVDSSVAAYLMQQRGFSCLGVTMKLYSNEDIQVSNQKTCCSLDDVEDARSVAHKLGIPYYVFNFSDDFKEHVIERFVRTYECGATPNPCIDCNRYLKFDRLYRRAVELGCDYVVTGHYARIEKLDERYVLKKALDEKKDQSYVLYSMTQEQLAHTMFPLGEILKPQIREIAAEQGFINAAKHDSQDICFVPDGDYAAFMEKYTGKTYECGDFLDINGQVIGRHQGAIRYTIGQRKGLGVAWGEPMYVLKKDMENNTVTVVPNDGLFSNEMEVCDLNWISIPAPNKPICANIKIRYKHAEAPGTIYPASDGTVRVIFDTPQRAIAPGQAAVFYEGDLVLGGGTIF